MQAPRRKQVGAGPRTAWRLGLPIGGALLLLGALAVSFGARGLLLDGLLVAYLLPPLSKESVLPLAIAAGFPPMTVAACFTAMDLLLAAFVAWNLDLLGRVPRLGPRWARWLSEQETAIGQRPANAALPFLATLLWMAVPLQGSGAATSTVLGRVLGLRPWPTFVAVAGGAALLNAAYSHASELLLRTVGLLGLLAIPTVVMAVAGLVAFRRRRLRRPRV